MAWFKHKLLNLFLKSEASVLLYLLNHTFLEPKKTASNREIKIHVYDRLRQTADVNLYHVTKFPPYFSPTLYCFYAKMSSFIPVLTIGIVLDSFHLLVFYSEKFSA